MPNVVTIPGVELVKTGTHEASTGTWTVSADDLRSAVAAYRAGAIRDPVITLGHVGGRGAPAFGRVRNLRLAQGGAVLVGDFVDVPRALAAVMARAWPQRSVEALLDYEAADGRTYSVVIDAVALLGAELPAVDGLADVADLYGVAAATAARRVILAATPDRAARVRAVKVAAARRRRTHRITIGA